MGTKKAWGVGAVLAMALVACAGPSEEQASETSSDTAQDDVRKLAEKPWLLPEEERALDKRLEQVADRTGAPLAEIKLLYSPKDIRYATMKADDPGGLTFLKEKQVLALTGDEAQNELAFENFRKRNIAESERVTGDGEAVLLHAIKFKQLGGKSKQAEAQAKAAVKILHAWAKANPGVHRAESGSDPFRNGWLVSSWGFGAMARGAFLLKSEGSEDYQGVAKDVEKWLQGTADKVWKKMPGSKSSGQLDSSWERQNVSNRTFASLEATLHVARLVGNEAWFNEGLQAFVGFAQSYVDPSGKNKDDERNDNWHPYAGIASGFQILRLGDVAHAKNGTTPREWESARAAMVRTSEYYANSKFTYFNRTAMPMWRAAVMGLGERRAPHTAAVFQTLRNNPNEEVEGFGVQFLWGFPGTIQ
jgi:hypothetical protein